MENILNEVSFLDLEPYSSKKADIVKAILQKAYQLKYNNSIKGMCQWSFG